eukprot:NODE_733_length_1942_cov_3.850502_g679_i0.p1 GENE.NODE_733_length_1942_cov_3.850502_g679_i0~~NODE_733_length_1942_cov_3.850502_g679_i0.p1  ORF type:complete len:410 (+),score=58.87 NODE_733_length_1942_cov_3.850502_g679_i0:63-1292(+)
MIHSQCPICGPLQPLQHHHQLSPPPLPCSCSRGSPLSSFSNLSSSSAACSNASSGGAGSVGRCDSRHHHIKDSGDCGTRHAAADLQRRKGTASSSLFSLAFSDEPCWVFPDDQSEKLLCRSPRRDGEFPWPNRPVTSPACAQMEEHSSVRAAKSREWKAVWESLEHERARLEEELKERCKFQHQYQNVQERSSDDPVHSHVGSLSLPPTPPPQSPVPEPARPSGEAKVDGHCDDSCCPMKALTREAVELQERIHRSQHLMELHCAADPVEALPHHGGDTYVPNFSNGTMRQHQVAQGAATSSPRSFLETAVQSTVDSANVEPRQTAHLLLESVHLLEESLERSSLHSERLARSLEIQERALNECFRRGQSVVLRDSCDSCTLGSLTGRATVDCQRYDKSAVATFCFRMP